MDPNGGPDTQDPAPRRGDDPHQPERLPRQAREDDAAVPAQIGEDPGTLGPGWDEQEER